MAVQQAATPKTRVTLLDILFTAIFFATVSALLLGFLWVAAPYAAAQSKDKALAAACDEKIKKQKGWDQFAKRRFLEQCLQKGTMPPEGDPAKPDRS